MNFPTPQGLSSSTFRPPPVDGSLLLPEIFDHHGESSPNHPLFRYVDAEGVVKTITWSHAVQGFHKAAHITRQQVGIEPTDTLRPVVGIVAAAVIAGILRAGYQAFPVSPRNSDVAIAHLLQSTGCTHVFVSGDNAMQKPGHCSGCETVFLFAPSDPAISLPPMRKVGLDAPAVILHSSGSTAFPKTIIFTHRILNESGLIPCNYFPLMPAFPVFNIEIDYGQMNLCGHVLSAHAVPMFHLMGVIQLPWTAFTGLTIAVFPPTSLPTIPTPDRVFDGAVATKSTLMFCVPAFLESWAREPHRLTVLQNFRTVIFAGGPLQPAVGDMLVQNGVHIAHVYGLTETSNVTLFLPESSPKEGWDYFYLSPHTDAVFEPVEDIPGVYHLIMKKTAIHTPAVLDTVVDGVPALRTNDLFLRHPTNPNLVKVYGRHDDQIMHSNGEKTNPGPLEAILLKDTRIKFAIMFGRSQFHAGVLLFPAESFDPANEKQVIEFRRSIWSTIVEANKFAPQHSRIFKEVLQFDTDPSRPIELTAKGTPRRQAVLDMYKEEIQAVYEAVNESSQTHIMAPQEYNFRASVDFVRRVVAEVMLEMPGDNDDIFQHGCDSLQATWIRNTILHALRNSQRVDMKTVPSNFVYTYSTVRLLADLVTRLASESGSRPEDVSRRADAMQAMVQKYTEGFPEHRGTAAEPGAEVVVLTGTTGALGSHILAYLLGSSEISKVYAFNRPSSQSDNIKNRHRTSFSANGLDVHLLESPKLKLLETNLNEAQFGMSSADYDVLKDSVTTIIHNAWQVNFNISLSSMEPLVAGTRQLVDFALSSPHPVPPRFIFVSTAGIFRNLNAAKVALEEHLSDPQAAVGLGYTESKWVAEQILENAGQKTPFSSVIVRPGQLSGATNGAWNSSDWFPTLLRSSQLLGHLPTVSGYASWFPIHHAAKAIIELRKSNDHYFHITHPKPVPMTDIMSPLSEVLDLPLVPYSAWLESLEAASLQEFAASNNPGVRLLDFFRSFQQQVSAEQDALSRASLSNARAMKAATSMSSVPPLATHDVKAWSALPQIEKFREPTLPKTEFFVMHVTINAFWILFPCGVVILAGNFMGNWGLLKKVPGPWLAARTRWYRAYFDLIRDGEFLKYLERLHKQYGPVVRVISKGYTDLCAFLSQHLDKIIADPNAIDAADHETIYHHLLNPNLEKHEIPSKKSLLDKSLTLLGAGSETVGNATTTGVFRVLHD
ncbi:Acetyl-CoA synthetase-like protein [Mycena venus]|uniref:Acetyl-CoA synthetase-like protein n=1 Tax=Mycena venus TaxID=2733690 RepID=A0A8H6Y5U9_9AGAR|nr:Acetyl-CoA synthetase-like protein [Mycena venus]